MAKRIDITDKLNFEEKPIIVVKGKEIEVNNDASTVLKILGRVEDEGTENLSSLTAMADMLFTEQGKKNLESLSLNINDYAKVVGIAMDLVIEDEETPGELENAGTISSETGI
jgi:hypothetical protein